MEMSAEELSEFLNANFRSKQRLLNWDKCEDVPTFVKMID